MHIETKPIALTIGMGIGAEICLKALPKLVEAYPCGIMVLGKKDYVQEELARGMLLCAHASVQYIWLEDSDEPAEIAAIRLATKLCLEQKASAMVTGPINKAVLMDKGFAFSGHTEFIGDLCGVSNPVMAFSGGSLQVVLVTTHIPLHLVSSAVTVQKIVHTVLTADASWKKYKNIIPRFAVAGINPHAGEQGKIGKEEIDVVGPACDLLRKQGVQVVGPVSAETAFLLARDKHVDVVVAMYHDQGLAPLKLVDFGASVNWTLGLPIIRTSVDHGTADSIIGKGIAKEDSLIAAFAMAVEMLGCVRNRFV